MDLDPEKSLISQRPPPSEENEGDGDGDPPLNKDPEYAKYFKMLKMGLAMGAAKQACVRDGMLLCWVIICLLHALQHLYSLYSCYAFVELCNFSQVN